MLMHSILMIYIIILAIYLDSKIHSFILKQIINGRFFICKSIILLV